MSFRSRMSLAIAVLTALTLGGAFAGVSAAFTRLQRKQLDLSLLAVARSEANEAPRDGFDFTSGPGPAANDVGPLTAFGVIFDAQGRTLAATAPFDVHPPDGAVLRHRLGEPFDLRHASGHVRGVLVGIPGHPDKRLFLATSREDLDGDEAFLFRAMFAAFAIAVTWVGLVAYWMGGRLIRDHHAIAAVARAVADGDLDARAHARSGDPEVQQLSQDINEMIERLSELVASQQRFIAHAAHELRSPLAALSGELQQALRRERDVDAYKRSIQSALVATRRLTLLAEDLLALARSKADAAPSATTIEVTTMLDQTIAALQPLAQAHGVTITQKVLTPARIADRNGDTSRLMRNLLENAIRFSPRNECVVLEAALQGSSVRISVSDVGRGVDEAEREQIFAPFFRGKGSGGTEGTGLGLGIAREIARSHGGDVELDAASGRGARFIVTLPLAPRDPSSVATTELRADAPG